MFTNGTFDCGEACALPGHVITASETLPVISFALVELRDGTQTYDAVVQRPIEDTRRRPEISHTAAHAATKTHMVLASEYRGPHNENYTHWLLLPPKAPGQLLPVPPGSVRGLWRERALSTEDLGKRITVNGSTITVNGESRKVNWEDRVPADAIVDAYIQHVDSFNEDGFKVVSVTADEDGDENPCEFINPFLDNDEFKAADIAFACVNETAQDSFYTTFHLPLVEEQPYAPPKHQLADAKCVTMGKKEFSHFVFGSVHKMV